MKPMKDFIGLAVTVILAVMALMVYSQRGASGRRQLNVGEENDLQANPAWGRTQR